MTTADVIKLFTHGIALRTQAQADLVRGQAEAAREQLERPNG